MNKLRLCFLGVFIMALTFGTAAARPRHDPTQPLNDVTELSNIHDGWQLNSILIGYGRRLAVINDRIIGLGQSIDGMRVTHIRSNRVTLRGSDKQVTLDLVPKLDRHKTLTKRIRQNA